MDNRKSMGRMLAILFLPSLIIGCTKSNEDDITGATWEGREVEKPALAVDVLKVAEGQLVPLVETSGLVEGINQAVVVAQNLGTIEAIFVEIGEEVTKDMVLLAMDDSVARLKLEQAREQMENARIVLEAQELLRNSGGVSQAELLRSRSSYRGAQAFYETSLKSFEDTTLKSPIKGVLAWKTLELEVGNYLSPGQTVYRVADLSGLRITLSVGERQVGLIETGAEVRITIPSALGTGEILGQVKAVGAGSDAVTGSYSVIIESGNPYGSAIKAGMTAACSITAADPRRGIIIPRSAVVNREGARYVFIEEEGIAVPRQIESGESFGNRLIIPRGLEPGVPLIVSGLGSVRPGDPVAARLIGTSEEGL